MWIRSIKTIGKAGLLLMVTMQCVHGREVAKQQPLPFQIFSNSAKADDSSGLDTPSFLQSPDDDVPTLGVDLAKLIRRSLFFSALAIVACLIVAFAGRQQRKRNGNSSKQIKLLETQILGPRCFGDLVQIREQYLFVARDAHGIKSVVPLTVAFDTELDEMDASPVDESIPQPTDSFRSRNQSETWPTKLPSQVT